MLMLVVAVQPVVSHTHGLLQAVEQIAVQSLLAVGPFGFIDLGIQSRLSLLDMVQGNAFGLRPFGQCMRVDFPCILDHMSSIVGNKFFR
jgi:hypothetical protein